MANEVQGDTYQLVEFAIKARRLFLNVVKNGDRLYTSELLPMCYRFIWIRGTTRNLRKIACCAPNCL